MSTSQKSDWVYSPEQFARSIPGNGWSEEREYESPNGAYLALMHSVSEVTMGYYLGHFVILGGSKSNPTVVFDAERRRFLGYARDVAWVSPNVVAVKPCLDSGNGRRWWATLFIDIENGLAAVHPTSGLDLQRTISNGDHWVVPREDSSPSDKPIVSTDLEWFPIEKYSERVELAVERGTRRPR